MTYLKLFFAFFRIGLFTIGGGYAMIPFIWQELLAGGYMTETEITDLIAIGGILPGPFAVNAATFTGMKLHALPGAVICTLGIVAPSIIITTFVALFFFNINKKPAVQAALYGIRPAVLALILFATFKIAQDAFSLPGETFSPDFISMAMFLAAFLFMLFFKKVSPIYVILGAGVIGAVFLR